MRVRVCVQGGGACVPGSREGVDHLGLGVCVLIGDRVSVEAMNFDDTGKFRLDEREMKLERSRISNVRWFPPMELLGRIRLIDTNVRDGSEITSVAPPE